MVSTIWASYYEMIINTFRLVNSIAIRPIPHLLGYKINSLIQSNFLQNIVMETKLLLKLIVWCKLKYCGKEEKAYPEYLFTPSRQNFTSSFMEEFHYDQSVLM